MKRILPYEIIIHCLLECRSKNSPYGMDRTVTSAVLLLQLNQPQLSIRDPDLIDPYFSERILLQYVDHGSVSLFGSWSDTDLCLYILLNQLQYGQSTTVGSNLIKEISLYLPLHFSKRRASLFPFRERIIHIQSGTMNTSFSSETVNVSESVTAVGELILSFA